MSAERGLLGGWARRLAEETAALPADRTIRPLPVSLTELAATRHEVGDALAATAMVAALRSLRAAAIAVTVVAVPTRPPVRLRGGEQWHDIHAVAPLAVALTAWAMDDTAGTLVTYVLDLADRTVVEALARVLALPVTLVFHDMKPALFALWRLGLDPNLVVLYDTHVAARALCLGRFHKHANQASVEDEAERMAVKRDQDQQLECEVSLAGQCHRYGLPLPLEGELTRLRLTAPSASEKPLLTSRVAEALAGEAEAVLRLYVAQNSEVVLAGLATHLYGVEFPFAAANARIEWRGVHIGGGDLARFRTAARQAKVAAACELNALGLADPEDAMALVGLLETVGLREAANLIRESHGDVDDTLLERLESLHPAIRFYRRLRKLKSIGAEDWFPGTDGRFHPTHVQLGAATGRNTCKHPNIAGIGKRFRPLVSAPPGRAIVELDYSQVEVAVMAAEHGDARLLAAYHSGDLYASMAKEFYADQLTADQLALDPEAFKRQEPALREAMKTLVLAVLYNMQPATLANLLSTSTHEAARMRERLLALFPAVRLGLEADSQYGLIRGYASIRTGLRRYLPAAKARPTWVRNFLRNTPIQGGATVVFKRAVCLMDAHFKGTSTWLILPVHDAIVIECDGGEVEQVVQDARTLMALAMKSTYPALRPKVEVNAKAPRCWNKDGHADSLERFLVDPLDDRL